MDNDDMGVIFELEDVRGCILRNLPDPSGGAFDAAGDFDRLLDWPTLSTLGRIDPYANTRLNGPMMPGLLDDVAAALSVSKEGPERRGLERLRAMALLCRDDPSLTLVVTGD